MSWSLSHFGCHSSLGSLDSISTDVELVIIRVLLLQDVLALMYQYRDLA